MNRRVTRVALVAIMSLAVLWSTPPATQAQGEPHEQGQPEITVTIDGQQWQVKPGDKIPLPSKAQLPPDSRAKGCDTGQMTFSVKNAPGQSGSGATFRVTDQCDLIIEETSVSQPASPPAGGEQRQAVPIDAGSASSQGRTIENAQEDPLAPLVTRNGWAYIEYHEQFGLHVTEVWSYLTYEDSGSTVYNARNPSGRCWWLSETGWGNTRCAQWSNLGAAWNHVEGDFTHTFSVYNHTMGVTFQAYPNGVTQCSGNFSGWVPAFWGYSCASGY